MRKKIIKYCLCGAICVVLVLSIVLSVGCGFDRTVNKASKNLTNYTISATLNEDTHTISASQVVEYINKTDKTLDNICFNLYPSAFRENASVKPYTALTKARCFPEGESFGDITISAVKVDGVQTNFVLDGEDENILNVNLNKILENKEKVNIEIDFTLSLPNCTHRFGYFDNNINLGNWYPIVCEYNGEDFDKTPYYATGDPFNSSVSNYDITFSTPSKYILASSGQQTEVNENAGISTYKLQGKAIRDFAIVLGSNFVKISDKVGNTTINYYGYAEDEKNNEYLKLACEAVTFFNDTFGLYPYRVLNVCKTPFMQGGMEYPNLVMISDNITSESEYRKVIVHEIAHQWWYGVCGNNEITDAWFDEGLAEYSTFLFFDKFPKYGTNYDTLIDDAIVGYNLYIEIFDSIDIDVNTKMNIAVNEFANEYEYTYMIYVRGVIMYDHMANEIGQKNFISGLKKIYKKYKFEKVDSEKFASCFGTKSGKIEEILNEFLNGNCYLDK